MVSLLAENGIELPTDVGYFERAQADAACCIEKIWQESCAEHLRRQQLAEARASMAAHDRDWRSRGLVTGKNAEEREDTLEGLRAQDVGYQMLRSQLDEHTNAIAAHGRELERQRELRSLAKRRCEYAIASLHAAGESR